MACNVRLTAHIVRPTRQPPQPFQVGKHHNRAYLQPRIVLLLLGPFNSLYGHVWCRLLRSYISFRVFNITRPGSMSLYLDRLADSHVLRTVDDILCTDIFKNVSSRRCNVEVTVMATQRDALDDAWLAREGGWEHFVREGMPQSRCSVRGVLTCTQYVRSSHCTRGG